MRFVLGCFRRFWAQVRHVKEDFLRQEGLSEILRLVSRRTVPQLSRFSCVESQGQRQCGSTENFEAKAFLNVEVDIPVADLKKVFDVLDEDDDGAISIKEMVQTGTLEIEDALYLSELLDKGQDTSISLLNNTFEDGEVSLRELMNLV